MPLSSRTQSSPALVQHVIEPLGLSLHQEVNGKGRGVFTTMPFKKGSEVLEFLGELREVEEFKDLTHALQVGDTTFIGPSGGVDDFVNHSCAPNTGIRDVKGRTILFALRNLGVGEEITFDYSTTQSGGYWTMECQCGAPQCRGVIGDFADLPKALRGEYIRNRAVLPFLIKD